MPFVYQQDINAATKIGIWHIVEAEDFFLGNVPLQQSITHPHKRLQHLAGRYMLKMLEPGFPVSLIKIADTRKPYLQDEQFHFSISHCGDYAAVIISSTERVGVDIEVPQEKIMHIKHKFLTDDEYALIRDFNASDLNELTLAWSIKEAMFKWYGAGNVDFRKNMKLVSIRKEGEAFMCSCIFKKDIHHELTVYASMLKGISLAFVHTP